MSGSTRKGAVVTVNAGTALTMLANRDVTQQRHHAGRDLVQLTAQNVINFGGRIAGSDAAVQARDDLNNIGGLNRPGF